MGSRSQTDECKKSSKWEVININGEFERERYSNTISAEYCKIGCCSLGNVAIPQFNDGIVTIVSAN